MYARFNTALVSEELAKIRRYSELPYKSFARDKAYYAEYAHVQFRAVLREAGDTGTKRSAEEVAVEELERVKFG